VRIQGFHFYEETNPTFPAACALQKRLHCHPAAAAVFDIVATHEAILEPSIFITSSRGNYPSSHSSSTQSSSPATTVIYATFPTVEANPSKHSLFPSKKSYVDHQMNLIFRRRAEAYGRFFDVVSKESSLKYNISFYTVLRDDCTLLSATSEALFRAGTFFGTFSHRGPVNVDRVLAVPDHRFIDTRGFNKLLPKLQSLQTPFDKKIPGLFWRGTSSGSKVACLDILRVQIALKLKNDPNADFKISKPKVCHLNNTTLDFSEVGILGSYVSEEEWIKYRAIIDVDGNFATNGLPWRVLSGSVLFRVKSVNSGWIEPLLEPYVHYLPIKSDLSDLHEATRLASTQNASEIAMLRTIAQNAMSLRSHLNYSSVVHKFSLDINKFSEMRAKMLVHV
jgi:hypothetical protein